MGCREWGLSQLLPNEQRGGGCELRILGQEEEMESAAMVSWQSRARGFPREGVSPVSTGPQGAPSPLMTRMSQRSRTRAVLMKRMSNGKTGQGSVESSVPRAFLPSQALTICGPFSPGVRAQSRYLPQGWPPCPCPCRTPPLRCRPTAIAQCPG